MLVRSGWGRTPIAVPLRWAVRLVGACLAVPVLAQVVPDEDRVASALSRLASEQSSRPEVIGALDGFVAAAVRRWARARLWREADGMEPWTAPFGASDVSVPEVVEQLIKALEPLVGAGRPRMLRSGQRPQRPEYALARVLGELAPYLADDEVRDRIQPLVIQVVTGFGFADAGVRRALFRLEVDAGAKLPVLVKLLKHENPYVRESAAEALGYRGGAAMDALPALVSAMSASHPTKVEIRFRGFHGVHSETLDSKIQRAAARAALRIAPHGDSAALAARFLLTHRESNSEFVLIAVRAVGALGAKAEPALPRLRKLLGDSNVKIAAEAATAIGMVGVRSASVDRALVAAAARPEAEIAARAAAALELLRRLHPDDGKTS